MQKSRTLLAGVLLALGMAFSVPTIAQAAPPTTQSTQKLLPATCVPEFVQGKTVYIAPDVNPNTFPNLKAEIEALASVHGLQVAIVACQAAYDWDKPAVDMDNAIVAKWGSAPGFDKDKFLVVTWIKKSDSAMNNQSIAADGGSFLLAHGLTKARMSSPDGPVARDAKTFRDNPKAQMLKIVRYANEDISHSIAMARLPYQIGGGIILLLIVGFGLFRFRGYSNAKGRAAAKIADWRSKFDHANQNWMDLQQKKYLDLFKTSEAGATDWKSIFKGKSLNDYLAATSAFDELNIRTTFAKQRVEEAEKAFASGSFLSFGGFDTAYALLTTQPITVTGKELADEKIQLFGTKTDDKTFQPDDLLAGMEDLFATANTKGAAIYNAMKGAQDNVKAINAAGAEVVKLRDGLVEKGLSFAPYEEKLNELLASAKKISDDQFSNPEEALDSSNALKGDMTALKAQVERASTVKDSLAPVLTSLSEVETRVATMRGADVGYKFPDQGAVDAGSSPHFLLSEEHGNPDTIVAKAHELLTAAGTALMSGKLDEAESERTAATAAIADASALLEKVAAAKAHVEKTVPAVREALAKLTGDVPAAQTAINQLHAEFLEESFSGQAHNIETANAVAKEVESRIAIVRKAYFEQRFVDASTKVDGIAANVQSARDGLVAVSHALETLKKQRDHAKTTAAAARTLVEALSPKLEKFQVSTSAATVTKYNNLLPGLPTLETQVDEPKAAWAALAASADQLVASLKEVDALIDSEYQDFDRAKKLVNQLDASVRAAYNSVSDSATRTAATSKYSEAQAVQEDLMAKIALPQQNWADLAKRAQAATAVADEASRLAKADRAAADSAGAELGQARADVASVNGQNSAGGYGEGQYANMSSANSNLANAEAAWGRREYEDAGSYARSASTDAANAATYARNAAQEIYDDRVAAAAQAAAAAAALALELERQSRRNDTVIISGGSSGGYTGGGGYQGGGYQGGGNSQPDSTPDRSDDGNSGGNDTSNDGNSGGTDL